MLCYRILIQIELEAPQNPFGYNYFLMFLEQIILF